MLFDEFFNQREIIYNEAALHSINNYSRYNKTKDMNQVFTFIIIDIHHHQ